MHKVIKYATCYTCDDRLDIGDDAVMFDDKVFCDRDCVNDHIEFAIDDIEIEEGNCEHEDENE